MSVRTVRCSWHSDNMSETRIKIGIDSRLYELLEKKAEEQKVTVDQLVNWAVREYLDRSLDEEKKS